MIDRWIKFASLLFSVIGLNFDFLSLNIVGFVLYSVFNVALYWIHGVQNDYFALHPTGVNPVQVR